VIHIGGHLGQESDLYRSLGLRVIWIEADPETHAKLEKAITWQPDQRALCYLLTDRDGDMVDFHVSSNAGASSSIFPLGKALEIWPKLHMLRSVRLRTRRFDRIVNEAGIDPAAYRGLVLDTQGSELLILKGMGDLLSRFDFIKTEAADFAAYDGGCTLQEIAALLHPLGFREIARQIQAFREGTGAYYDVTFAREVTNTIG
jgi:FkbM family methyltransferase